MSKDIKITEKNPDLSIIVSMYNEEDSLDVFFDKINETLRSLSNYTYEIICIDDASPDNSGEILRRYQKNMNKYILSDTKQIEDCLRREIPDLEKQRENTYFFWIRMI